MLHLVLWIIVLSHSPVRTIEMENACSSLTDCLRQEDSVPCGICGVIFKSSEGERDSCMYNEFDYRFTVEIENRQCYRKNQCNRNDICINKGECIEGFGTFRCRCKVPFFGHRCERTSHVWTQDQANAFGGGFQVFLPNVVSALTRFNILISTDTPQPITLQMRISTSEGDEQVISSPTFGSHAESVQKCQSIPTLLPSDCNMLKSASPITYMASLELPGKNMQHNFQTEIKTKNKISGYFTNISVVIRQEMIRNQYEELFQKDYPLFVKYTPDVGGSVNNIKSRYVSVDGRSSYGIAARDAGVNELVQCTPVAFIQSCETQYASRTRHYVWEQLTFNGIAKAIDINKNEIDIKNCEGEWKYVWYIYKAALVSGVRKYVDHVGPIFATEYVVQRFSLTPEEYLIKFEVHLVSSLNEGKTHVQCYFEIVVAPLVAIITGGSERTVHFLRDLAVSAEESHDPNISGGLSKVGLHFFWICYLTDNKDRECFNGFNGYGGTRKVFSYFELPPRAKMTFTVWVSKAGFARAYATQAVTIIEDSEPVALICQSCIKGTGIVNPKEDIYFMVVGEDNRLRKDENYVWVYKEPHEIDIRSLESIRVQGTSRSLCIIKKNQLKSNATYLIMAQVGDGKVVKMLHRIIFTPVSTEYHCTIQPDEGIKGITLFNISCIIPYGMGMTYIYELYDKSPSDETLFSGRMLGTSFKGEFYNFRLTRGTLVVYCYDIYKAARELIVPVKLYEFNGTVVDVDNMVTELDILVIERYHERVPRLASVVPDVLTAEMNREHLIRYLVASLSQTPVLTMADIKLSLSSVQNIFATMTTKFENFTMDADVAKQSADVLLVVTEVFMKHIFYMQYERTLTQTILYQMLRAILDTVKTMLDIKNIEVRTNPEEYVNPVVLDLVQQTSFVLVHILDIMSSTFFEQQLIGDVARQVNSSDNRIEAWVKVDSPENMRIETKEVDFPMKISGEVVVTVTKLTTELGVQFIRLKVDPFWWSPANIVTDILSAAFCHKTTFTLCHLIPVFKSPVNLVYDVEKPIALILPVEGTTYQLDETKSVQDLDLDITVYRFDPPAKAKLFLEFLIDENQEYRVFFSKYLRPDYDDMMGNLAINISGSSEKRYTMYDLSDTGNFYYMGILPGPQRQANTSLNFTIKMHYALCLTWLKWQWSNRGCWVGDPTNYTTLFCQCTHFSYFAGTVNIPPHDVNHFAHFPLFLSPNHNFIPLIILIIILLLYLLLLIWGKIKDKKDKVLEDVIILEDNYPGERYAYLLGVYTGSRWRASTTANVGVRLYGDDGETRAHILKSSSRKVFKGNTDDWFLIYSPQHLGRLTSLQLWHDNSSSSPDWFVEKIEVYDLEDNLRYLFELNMWIALEMDEYPDAVVLPANLEQYFSVKSVFISNVISGFRDSHNWTSIFFKHPRNPVTRLERVQVVMCFIMIAFLISLLLYLARSGLYHSEDYPSLILEFFALFVFIVAFFAASLVACMIMFFFRKSYSFKYRRNKSSLFLSPVGDLEPVIERSRSGSVSYRKVSEDEMARRRSSNPRSMSIYSGAPSRYMMLSKGNLDENFIRFGLRSRPRTERTTYQNFVLAIHSSLRGTPLSPVKLPMYRSGLILHKLYFFLGWILSLIIILVSAIIVILVGWYLPKVTSLIWALVFFGVLLFDAIIVSTLKILLFSTLLAFFFQRLIECATYHITPRHGQQRNLVGDVDHLYALAAIRCQPMYCPLSDRMKAIFRKQRERAMRWKTVIDFFVVILLLIILFMLSFLYTKELLSSNAHAKHMITHGHKYNVPHFDQIFNRTHFEEFMERNFLSQLYRYMWYNLSPLVDLTSVQSRRKDFTDDCVTKLLGNSRIRQLRVKQGTCTVVRYFENMTEDCSPPWSSDQEDKDVYDLRWFVGHYEDVEAITTAWRHIDSGLSNSSRSYGKSGTLYHAGGYIANMGYTRKQTQIVILGLTSDLWLDHMTRAVFVEMTLYNVNTGLFSQVVLVAEQTPIGEYITLAKVESVSTEFSVNLWIISFLVFFIFLFIRMCILINRNGMFEYFSKRLNVYEAFLLALGFGTIVLCYIHVKTSSFYISKFQRGGLDEFFNFFTIIVFAYLTKAVFCVLIACVVIRLFVSWRFGRTFITFYYTFMLSWPWIVWLTLYFILYLFITWRGVGYFLNIFLFPFYSYIIFYYKDFYLDWDHLGTLHKLFVYIWCMLSAFILLLFVISFLYYYRIAKYYRLIDTDTFNMAIFLRNEIKMFFAKRKNKKP